MIQRKSNKFAKIFLIFYAVLLVLMTFQNCGQVGLGPIAPLAPIVTSSEASQPTYLKPPTDEVQRSRLVVFMDMSQSMVSQYCDHDISSPTPANTPVCYISNSADPDLWRLKNLRNWLVKLQGDLTAEALAETRVLIVPFTGGLAELKRSEPTIDGAMQFVNLADSLQIVDRLMAEQVEAKSNILAANPAEVVETIMGTSVPLNRLEILKTRVKDEIILLGQQGVSSYASFQILVFSDGEPVPSSKNVKDTIERVWAVKEDARGIGQGLFGYSQCISLCSGVVQNWIDNNFSNVPSVKCRSQYYSGSNPDDCKICRPEDSYICTGGDHVPNSVCPAYCVAAIDSYNQTGLNTGYGFVAGATNTLFNDIKTSWGQFESNTPSKIVRSINGLRAIFSENSEVQYQVHFFKIDKYKLNNPPPPAPNPVITNWLDLAKVSFTKNTTHKLVTSASMDQTLFQSLQSSSSYKIRNFFVFNLNARVDKYGVFSVDSDGDGLFDRDDESPSEARSNGICLDIIAENYGCLALSCSAKLDIDGDGLNECEERTMGTDSYDFDTDNDGLPDLIEIIYGSNPKKNSTLENSNPQSDSQSDFNAVFYGLHPYANWNEINENSKMKFTYQIADPKRIPTKSGTFIQTWGYVAKIDGFPSALKLTANPIFDMFNSRTENETTKHKISLLKTSPSTQQNNMLILISLVSTSNPNEIYWFALNKPMDVAIANQPIRPIDLNLGELLQLKAKDPQGEFK